MLKKMKTTATTINNVCNCQYCTFRVFEIQLITCILLLVFFCHILRLSSKSRRSCFTFFCHVLKLSTKSRRWRDYETSGQNNCHHLVGTHQHVPSQCWSWTGSIDCLFKSLWSCSFYFILSYFFIKIRFKRHSILRFHKLAPCSHSSWLANDSTSCGANWKSAEDF